MSDYITRLYEENEVHRCINCGQTVRVLFAAVPIDPLECCGKMMELIGIQESDDGLDLSEAIAPEDALSKVYQKGDRYICIICGLEVEILRNAQPSYPLDCCGEGMDLVQ